MFNKLPQPGGRARAVARVGPQPRPPSPGRQRRPPGGNKTMLECQPSLAPTAEQANSERDLLKKTSENKFRSLSEVHQVDIIFYKIIYFLLLAFSRVFVGTMSFASTIFSNL
jgi:hypothetical protein